MAKSGNKACERDPEGRPPYPNWRPEIVVPEMLRSAENWDKAAEYVRATLLAKKEEDFLSYSSPIPRHGSRQQSVA